jgi:hypothetical protein
VIDLPDGDSYGIGDEIEIRITVSDADGVAAFSWGILSAINQGLAGGNEDCGNAPQCSTEASFTAVLSGDFQIGVEVKDAKGEGTIRTSQLYVR